MQIQVPMAYKLQDTGAYPKNTEGFINLGVILEQGT